MPYTACLVSGEIAVFVKVHSHKLDHAVANHGFPVPGPPGAAGYLLCVASGRASEREARVAEDVLNPSPASRKSLGRPVAALYLPKRASPNLVDDRNHRRIGGVSPRLFRPPQNPPEVVPWN